MNHYNPEDFGYCDICHAGGGQHESECPHCNSEQVGVCDLCRQPIMQGDDVIKYDSLLWHTDCFLVEYQSEA